VGSFTRVLLVKISKGRGERVRRFLEHISSVKNYDMKKYPWKGKLT